MAASTVLTRGRGRTKWRRLAMVPVVVLVAGLLQVVDIRPASAALVTDNSSTDRTETMSDGTTIKLRVLARTSGKPANGWPLVIYRAGRGTNRCENITGQLTNYTADIDSSTPTTLTTTSGAVFTSAHVGMPITVPGIGANGSTMTTTISAVASGTSITLAQASIAGTDVNDVAVTWSTPYLTRAEVADAGSGYAVLSYNARGGPAGVHQGYNPSGVSGCTTADDGADALNDGGWGQGSTGSGNKDKQDVKELIDYALTEFTNSDIGCSTAGACFDTTKIAMIGSGEDGLLTWLMPSFDSRIDAIVPIGTPHLVRNVAAISNQPLDLGWQEALLDSDHGVYGHSHPDVLASWNDLTRSKYINITDWPVNATGSVSNCTTPYATDPDCKVLNITGGSSPLFEAGDDEQPINIEGGLGGYPGLPGSVALPLATRITNVNSTTQVALADAVQGNVTGVDVSWPNRAGFAVSAATTSYFDERTVLDDADLTGTHEASDLNMPVFVVHGWLDGVSSPIADILSYTAVGGSNKYLYLGPCGAYPAPCGSAAANVIRDKVLLFLNKHIQAAAPNVCASGTGCVFYSVPPKTTGTPKRVPDTGWATPTERSSWANSISATGDPYCFTADAGPDHAWTLCSPYSNPGTLDVTSDQSEYQYACLVPGLTVDGGYDTGESEKYTSGTLTVDTAIAKVEADLYVYSDQPRFQVFLDLFEVNSDGTETRVWQGLGAQLPVARNQVAGSGGEKRFQFVPGGAAWTFASGSKIRFKISSQYEERGTYPAGVSHAGMRFAQEPFVGTNYISHTAAKLAKVLIYYPV